MNADNSYRDVPDAASRRRIEERAYYIWLVSGRRHGDHEHHWLQAERDVMQATKHEEKPQSDVHNGKKAAKPHKS